MPTNPSNTTLAYVSQYNQQQQEATNQHYQDTMIPIVAVGLGVLAIQQAYSYLQRNSTIGERRRMIEQQQAVSAELVFPVLNLEPDGNMMEGASLEAGTRQPNVAPNLPADRREGESSSSLTQPKTRHTYPV